MIPNHGEERPVDSELEAALEELITDLTAVGRNLMVLKADLKPARSGDLDVATSLVHHAAKLLDEITRWETLRLWVP